MGFTLTMINELPKVGSQPDKNQPAIAISERKNGWEEDRSGIHFPWELLVRLRDENLIAAKTYLAARDGRKCTLCGMSVQNILKELELDHADENQRNNKRWNLRLAHHSYLLDRAGTAESSSPAGTPNRITVAGAAWS